MSLQPTPQTTTGFLLIDKPVDWTSHDVVAKLRGITKTKTVGHAGTLDPFATGLLIVGVGRAATKELHRFLKADKHYEATARFDGATDTDDVTGTIVQIEVPAGDAERGSPAARTKEHGGGAQRQDPRMLVAQTFAQQVGDIMQVPPAYSAKKQGGHKMYSLARAGKTVVQEPVPVHIFSLDVTHVAWPDVSFTVHCTSGTYIRAIARDVGATLGTGGYLTALRRLSIGDMSVAHALPLSQLSRDNWQEHLWNFPTPTSSSSVLS